MWPTPQETADLATFTEGFLNGKLHFFCSARLNKQTFTLVIVKEEGLLLSRVICCRKTMKNMSNRKINRVYIQVNKARIIHKIHWDRHPLALPIRTRNCQHSMCSTPKVKMQVWWNFHATTSYKKMPVSLEAQELDQKQQRLRQKIRFNLSLYAAIDMPIRWCQPDVLIE